MSTIYVLMIVGISSIVVSSLLSAVLSQNKEAKAVAEILSIKDFEKSVTAVLNDRKICSFILANTNFQTAGPKVDEPLIIDVSDKLIPATLTSTNEMGVALAGKGRAISSHVNSIKLQAIKYIIYPGRIEGSLGYYNTKWQFEFDTSAAVRSFKSIEVDSVMTAEKIDASRSTIKSCMGYTENSVFRQNCPRGMAVNGYDNKGFIKCVNNYVGCSAGLVYNGVNADGTPICIKQVTTGSCGNGQAMNGISVNNPPTCKTL